MLPVIRVRWEKKGGKTVVAWKANEWNVYKRDVKS